MSVACSNWQEQPRIRFSYANRLLIAAINYGEIKAKYR